MRPTTNGAVWRVSDIICYLGFILGVLLIIVGIVVGPRVAESVHGRHAGPRVVSVCIPRCVRVR